MEEKAFYNRGGINGLGEGLVDQQSSDFKALQEAIQEYAANRSEKQHMEDQFLSIRFQMEAYLNDLNPNRLIEAGAFVEQFLAVIKVKKKHFSKYVGVEESNFSAILKGRRKVNADLAIKLGHIFRLPSEIWLHIESKNELLRTLKKAEQKYADYSLSDLLERAS